MKIINIEQGSPEWLEARRCKVTGTRLEDVMGTELAQLQLISELIAEKATEQTKSFKVTEAMERGTNEEVFAIKKFTEVTGKKVENVGICISNKFDWLACSPDGLIGKKHNEALEVKSPDSSTAVFYKITAMCPDLQLTKSQIPFLGIPAKYKWQCINYFLVNENLEKLHFAVYDARFINDDHKLNVITIERSNPALQEEINVAMDKLVAFREKWLKLEELTYSAEF